MTAETRKFMANHFRKIGRGDHPYCLEFPEEQIETFINNDPVIIQEEKMPCNTKKTKSRKKK